MASWTRAWEHEGGAAIAGVAAAAIRSVSQQKRTSWGFFVSAVGADPSDGAPLIRISAPAIRDERQPPDVLLARPVAAEDKRLVFGPFAFRLSPSSETLAWLLATRLRAKLKGARVLEVGAGLGLTGLACAAWCEPDSITLTDGDPQAVSLLRRNVVLNRSNFGATTVEAADLLWGAVEGSRSRDDEAQQYDVILSADCVYDRDLHRSLCQTLRRHVRPGGVILVVASHRCGSLDDFECCARADFHVDKWSGAYDEQVTSRFAHAKCRPGVLCLTLPTRVRRGDVGRV
eukprot:25431-Prymnesium_polylepis.1